MHILRYFCAPAMAMLLGSAIPAAAQDGDRFTTSEKFDAADIRANPGRRDKVHAHIDANNDKHVEQLRRWLRQPSVSAESRGVEEMGQMLIADLRALGFQDVRAVPNIGHPGVWGWYDAGAAKTLVVYMMFDVQPIEPTGWSVDAFAADIVDVPQGKALMARGATNQKGPERAFLNALESVIAVDGKPPVNIIILAEGDEEQGSPYYSELADQFADRLKRADGVLFPVNSQGADGSVNLSLGVKGHIYFELEAVGGQTGGPDKAEIHSSWKAVVDSPAWRLVQALASLTTPDGNRIAVPHYYDSIRPPSDEEQRLVNGMAAGWTAREAAQRQLLGVSRWTNGWTGKDALAHYLFDTTLNIDGISSGYSGPGVKTILPHRAFAKLDSRLVPGQTPDNALRLIREHLDRNGFGDVVMRRLSGYQAAQTSVDTAIGRTAIGLFNHYDITPTVAPRIAGSAPYYVFTEKLGLPMVGAGLGFGTAMHAPNEYMVIAPKPGSRIASLAQVEKYYADFLYAFAASK